MLTDLNRFNGPSLGDVNKIKRNLYDGCDTRFPPEELNHFYQHHSKDFEEPIMFMGIMSKPYVYGIDRFDILIPIYQSVINELKRDKHAKFTCHDFKKGLYIQISKMKEELIDSLGSFSSYYQLLQCFAGTTGGLKLNPDTYTRLTGDSVVSFEES